VRIGIFGGSFDPPHIGHLLIAGDAHEALGLDRLIWIPAGVQPLKIGQAIATGAQRIHMVRLLLEGDPRFEVDSVEIDRPGLSYTVDTLAEYARRQPDAELFLLVGVDVARAFAQWREPERIAQLATIVVLQRATDMVIGDGATVDLSAVPGRPRALATRRIDVSSTEIRERVRSAKSIRGFVSDAVAELIAAEGLYR
jgi:nicotinate-nucleotide adenylyltransferase